MKTTATINQLNEALEYVNRGFGGNVRFREIKQISKNTVQFTLSVKDHTAPGHSKGFNKRLNYACWHVHGYFFEYLFLKYDNIKISAGNMVMRSNDDNWQNWSKGRDLMASQACDCKDSKLTYKSIGAWRGYEEPINAVCGANNTGNWSDSPCSEHICLSELNKAKKRLINAKIPYKFQVCETSNVFCSHVYLTVKGKARQRAKTLIKPLISETRLLYVC